MSNVKKDGQGYIWWISNSDTNRTKLEYPVNGVEQAKLALNILMEYDLALGNLIESNFGGFYFYHAENDEKMEFEDNEGNDIWDLIDMEREQNV